MRAAVMTMGARTVSRPLCAVTRKSAAPSARKCSAGARRVRNASLPNIGRRRHGLPIVTTSSQLPLQSRGRRFPDAAVALIVRAARELRVDAVTRLLRVREVDGNRIDDEPRRAAPADAQARFADPG